jgi:hypothetical protein
LCPAPAQGSANITGIYTAQYGVPPVGKKVFVSVNRVVDGCEDLSVTFPAILSSGTGRVQQKSTAEAGLEKDGPVT